MIVYSVEWKDRRQVRRRAWFATARAADDWMHSDSVVACRNKIGPNKHVIEGKGGLLSFLQTYRPY